MSAMGGRISHEIFLGGGTYSEKAAKHFIGESNPNSTTCANPRKLSQFLSHFHICTWDYKGLFGRYSNERLVPLSRDGGTGRRSGLKIRRCLAPWGFNSPSRHQYSEDKDVTVVTYAVLLQKPMGETLREARTILEICQTKRLIAAVNFQLRFAPNMLMAWRLCESGALGNIHDMEVRVSVMTPWHLWDFLQKAPRIEILYHSIHYVDLVRSWFGNPISVLAKTLISPEAAHLAPTKSVIVMDYGDDKCVFINTNHSHYFSAQSQESFVQWEGTYPICATTLYFRRWLKMGGIESRKNLVHPAI
jgi:hypothetical protein